MNNLALPETNGLTAETARNKVFDLEARMLSGLPEGMEFITLPLREFFADDCYVREVFMPAGSYVTGHIHKHRHVSICSLGKAEVFDETGLNMVQAGDIFISEPGIKRALHILEDCRFINVFKKPKYVDEDDQEGLVNAVAVRTNEEFMEYIKLQNERALP